MFRSNRVIFAAALMAVLSSCEPRGTDLASMYQPVDEIPNPVTFSWLKSRVFDPVCSQCHHHDGLFTSEAALLSATAGGEHYVVPGNAAASLVYQRMTDSLDPMPPDGMLEARYSEAVRQYIESLAP